MPMTPLEALQQVLHDMHVTVDDDADEVISELKHLGFKIVPDDIEDSAAPIAGQSGEQT